tara:strand:+ start:904 stop:1329 length:426 start_codon:yes stop_codon:yes gene_type:complete
MKIDIIKPDGTVSKDGVSVSGLSLSNSIFNDVWAVHWDSSTSKGYVEKTDLSVEDITDFTPYESAVTEYDASYVANTTASNEEILRSTRDNLLTASDWTQLSDSPLSSTKKTEWATYRQALRDLPANTSDFANPTYPTEPT